MAGDDRPTDDEPPLAWRPLLREAAAAWWRGRAPHAAALAFSAVFAAAPLLLIALAAAGEFYGHEAANGQLREAMVDLLGPDGAALLSDLIGHSRRGADNLWAALVGTGLLMWAVFNLTVRLKAAVNEMWGGPPPPTSYVRHLGRQLVATLLVIASGCLMLASLAVNVWVAAVAQPVARWLPDFAVLQLLDLAVSLAVQAALLTVLLKYLPDRPVSWRAAAAGGLAATVVLHIGKTLFGLYLSKAAIKATYGAAASVVVLLLWAYYSAQMFLLGAEITRVVAQAPGRGRGAQLPS